MDEVLLDSIYETVLHPEAWEDVLRRLADGLGAEGAALVWQDLFTNAPAGIFSRTDPDAIDLYSGYFATRNPLRPAPAEVRRQLKAWTPRIVLDEDRMAKSDFVRTEFYNDFFRPFTFHASMAIGLEVAGRHGGTLDVLRSRRAGEFSEANMVFAQEAQPHLSRAFRAGREAASKRAGLSPVEESAFDTWAHGVLVVTGDRRVLYSNGPAQAAARNAVSICVVGGVLAAADASAAKRLERLVSLAADRDGDRRAGSFLAAPAGPDRLPLTLSIMPLRAEAHPLFSAPAVLVIVKDPSRDLALDPESLRVTFGLTTTETKVALALFAGQPSSDVAAQLGISVNTVRNHLAHILEKTHSSGQAELSRRLMSLA